MNRPFIEIFQKNNIKSQSNSHIDGVNIETILSDFDSPTYVTSLSAVQQRIEKYSTCLRDAFSSSRVFYALKANSAAPILREVIAAGCGADIVSIGEWRAALKAGFLPKDICFAGVGKQRQEWEEAIQGGVGYLNVEHISELKAVLEFLSQHPESKTKIAVRINPCLNLKTHPHLKTGSLDSKFGVLFEHLKDAIIVLQKQNHTKQDYFNPISGLHLHVGSQIENPEILNEVVKVAFANANALLDLGIKITHLDFGGGLHVGIHGVPADASDIRTHIDNLKSYAQDALEMFPDLKNLWGKNFQNLEICLEPGRSIVASSTIYLTRVLYEKKNSDAHHFCYVDAGMNDFPRPSLYGATHEVGFASYIQKDDRDLETQIKYQIVGPVCESADFLARNVQLPQVLAGDVLVFFEAGAYCFAMASHYNLRALPTQVFVKNGEVVETISRKEPE